MNYNSLFHLKDESWGKIVLAYEPVWAIGTGETASLVQIQEMRSMIRKHIADRYSTELANSISILYGGSVKPENSQDIFSAVKMFFVHRLSNESISLSRVL